MSISNMPLNAYICDRVAYFLARRCDAGWVHEEDRRTVVRRLEDRIAKGDEPQKLLRVLDDFLDGLERWADTEAELARKQRERKEAQTS